MLRDSILLTNLSEVCNRKESNNETVNKWFNAMVLVVDCGTLSWQISQNRKTTECLEIYVADETFHCFKIRYYGQSAVINSSTMLYGDILLIDNMSVSYRGGDTCYSALSVVETTTYTIHSSVSFQRRITSDTYPRLFKRLQELMKWTSSKYPLLLSR
jgi:hypothetical protein